MKLKQINILKKKVLLVDDCKEMQGVKEVSDKIISQAYPKHLLNIPPGNWKQLSTLNDLTEEQAAELVEEYPSVRPIFRNYFSDGHFRNSTESFLSALEKEGVLFENPRDWPHDKQSRAVHEAAEANVFSENTLIFIELK